MSFIPFLQAATGTASSASTSGSLISTLVPFLLIIVIFYFFLIRPQNKKQKETEKMLNSLKKGDKVITIGGIHGVISSVKENTVVLKVDGDVKIEFNRSAISTRELSEEEKAKIAEDKAAKKTAKKEKKSLKETSEEKTIEAEVSKDASEESKKDSEEENK